ncbi:MAG: alpha/beta fold hydrolase [Flavobacteriales bacterium]|nr:alpha/beta fold hydrolase [Flavobacteriales bacterium]
MISFREERTIAGSGDRPITLDVTFNPDQRQAPIVVFCHGWKGFKDWGPWNVLADYFAEQNCFFVKFNYAHNGINPSDLSDITDPESFAQNTFSYQLEDIDRVINWLTDDNEEYRHYYNVANITLIGHSLGGAMAILKTLDDERINRVISWAGAYNLRKFAELDTDEHWKEKGHVVIQNSRTGQEYPLHYSFREDFLTHLDKYDLVKRLTEIDQPLMMIHGLQDDVSPISNARKIHKVVSHSLLMENEGNHTFGGSHPWTEKKLPPILQQAADNSIEFISL